MAPGALYRINHLASAGLTTLPLWYNLPTLQVGALADAMREAGLDPDGITGPIEEEYAAMELGGASGEESGEGEEVVVDEQDAVTAVEECAL